MTAETIFSKIISGEIQCDLIYKDDLCIAFNDIQPQAPIHILVIPLKPIVSLNEIKTEDAAILGHLLLVTKKVAKIKKLDNWRTVINTGSKAGQSVFHLHIHILGGREMTWPPG
mgnify:CR=1 FL=1|tara:strand:- start:34577 stop:34918 length:342 start_codon:yes stop_codon:yes gene_type:complete